MQLSESLTWPSAILFGILRQLSAHSKAVSIFSYSYSLILFYMKLIPFDISLAFFIEFYFLLVSSSGKKIYFVFCISFPCYSTPSSPCKPLFFSYTYSKTHFKYNSSPFPFLSSLLQSFNFIYSYVPLCLWMFSSLSFDCFLHLEILLQCLLLDVLLCSTL